MDGVRTLHAEDPVQFSTAALAKRFSVSPESIRRILKSRWQPSDAEKVDRELRWKKRGERLREMMMARDSSQRDDQGGSEIEAMRRHLEARPTRRPRIKADFV